MQRKFLSLRRLARFCRTHERGLAGAAACGALSFFVISSAVAQTNITELTRPIPVLDSDHHNSGGALHSPTPILGFNSALGKDVVHLFFHGGLFNNAPMNPNHAVCPDGDNISVALVDPEDIGTPATIPGYLYTQFPRMGRVSPCSTDTHAQKYDSMGDDLGLPGESWTHSPPFTDGGFLTDYSGTAGKFMIMARGNEETGHLKKVWLFRSTTWNSRKGQWNAGIFPLLYIDKSVINSVVHVSPIVLPPTPTVTTNAGGQRTVAWHGYFRWNGVQMGRIIVEFSPDQWGPVNPVRVQIQDEDGIFQSLGPSGVLNFVPRKVHKDLTGRGGTPLQIYEEGGQRYLITRRHQGGHNSNYPSDTANPNCLPGTPNYNNIYLPQRGGTAYKLQVFPLLGPHVEGAPGTLISSHRTVTGQTPTDYSVSLMGSGLIKVNGTTYFLSADRLDSICSRLMCPGNGWVNPFCGLDISASEVVLN